MTKIDKPIIPQLPPDIQHSFIAGECIIFKTTKCKYELVLEDAGYIFRNHSNRKFGHSGHSPRRDTAIKKFYQTVDKPNTNVYFFETRHEMLKWLNQ